MKADGLLSILTFSEYRRKTLFLLRESPKTLTEIKDYFKVSNSEIHPRLKEMTKAGILERQGDLYCITPIGYALSRHFEPLLDTISAIEANEDFWKDHDLSSIPHELLYHLKDLKDCTLVTEDFSFESHPQFIKNIMNAERVAGVSPVFNPGWPKMFLGLAKKGVEVSLIVTLKVFEKIKENFYLELEEGLTYKNAKMFICEDTTVAFAVTDSFCSLSLFTKEGVYDSTHDLIGFDKNAIRWFEKLFKYHLDNSIEVEGMLPVNEFVCAAKSEEIRANCD